MTRPTYFTPLPIRNPMDQSCIGDMERLEPSNLIGHLESDLTAYPLSYMEKHYPEFVFGHEIGRKPKGKTVVARHRGGWRWATWRTV